ncbi:Uncharacterized protein FWK35_00011602, partial [Aphis craccivora]
MFDVEVKYLQRLVSSFAAIISIRNDVLDEVTVTDYTFRLMLEPSGKLSIIPFRQCRLLNFCIRWAMIAIMMMSMPFIILITFVILSFINTTQITAEYRIFKFDFILIIHNNVHSYGIEETSIIIAIVLSGAMNVLILQCCVFFFCVSVYTRTCRNNARISNFEGGFRFIIESSWCIEEFSKAPGKTKKKKKNDGKTVIFTRNQFSNKTIFLYGCNSKTNHFKNLKFSPNDIVDVHNNIRLAYKRISCGYGRCYLNDYRISKHILDTERSDECIDFTKLFFFFFVSVYTRTCRNNARISNFEGGFRFFSKAPGKTKKKINGKREFLRKTSFRPKCFFYMVVIQKLITSNFQNILTFFDVAKIFWMPKKLENLIQVQIFMKSVKNANICKIKNTTL